MRLQQYIKENYILSSDSISCDIDDFISGKKKTLFVAGLSGSGKSTISRILSKKLNFSHTYTDQCIKKYLNLFKISKEEFNKNYLNCVNDLVLSKKGIVEGTGIIELYYYNKSVRKKLLDSPMIILGLSAIRSTYRAVKRDVIDFDKPYFQTAFKTLNLNFKDLNKKLDKLRKDRISVSGTKIKILEL